MQTPTWSRWARKGGLAAVDQALFAGTHFVLNILLARWLSQQAYGAFALAYTVAILPAAVHTGALVEPMTVFGAGRYRDRFGWYLGIVLRGHWWGTAGLALTTAAAAAVVALAGGSILAPPLFALAITQPAVLLLYLTRRAVYVPSKPQWSVAGGIVYAALVLGGAWGLRHGGGLSAASAVLLMGVGSGLVGAGLLAALRPERCAHPAAAGKLLAESWTYGRWAVGVHVLMWATNNLFLVLAGAFGSLADVGGLRAMMNVYLPFQHFMIAMAAVLLPTLAHAFWNAGGAGVRAFAVRAGAVLAPLSLAYVALVGVWGDQMIELLYGGRYSDVVPLLWLAAPLPILWTLLSLVGNGLRALERPDAVFRGYLISAIAVIVFGVPLILFWGVKGALLCLSTSLVIAWVTMILGARGAWGGGPAVLTSAVEARP